MLEQSGGKKFVSVDCCILWLGVCNAYSGLLRVLLHLPGIPCFSFGICTLTLILCYKELRWECGSTDFHVTETDSGSIDLLEPKASSGPTDLLVSGTDNGSMNFFMPVIFNAF